MRVVCGRSSCKSGEYDRCIDSRRRDLDHRLAPVSAGAFFTWGALLGLAPLLVGLMTWRGTHGVFATALAAGLAAVAVVATFALTTGRRL